jgi:hypothetical protein
VGEDVLAGFLVGDGDGIVGGFGSKLVGLSALEDLEDFGDLDDFALLTDFDDFELLLPLPPLPFPYDLELLLASPPFPNDFGLLLLLCPFPPFPLGYFDDFAPLPPGDFELFKLFELLLLIEELLPPFPCVRFYRTEHY